MLTKTKILAVTRDPVLIDLLQKELNDDKFEIVNTQRTGIYLKDIVDTERPDFIILDIVVPALDGIGTCLQLRQWTQTPVMMLSTWDTSDGTVRGLNLGAENYLTEPFGVDTLKTRIEDTLKRNTAAAIDPLTNIRTNKN